LKLIFNSIYGLLISVYHTRRPNSLSSKPVFIFYILEIEEIFLYYSTTQQKHINQIYFISPYINIYRHVSVASATIIRVSYKNTNNIQQIKWTKCTIKTISV